MFTTNSGHKLNIEKITHIQVTANQVTVNPVDYHSVILVGDEGERLVEAAKAAGFVGEDFLINPKRVSVIEPAANLKKVYLEGADKILFISNETAELLEKALDIPALETPAPIKARAAKKGAD